MKKILLLLVIALFTVGAQAGTTYKDGTECGCDSVVQTFYANGDIESEVPYLNGKIHGTYYYYYKGGGLLEVAAVLNGEVHGPKISYHSNGKVWSIATVKNGKNYGRYYSYNDDGTFSYMSLINQGEVIYIEKIRKEKGLCVLSRKPGYFLSFSDISKYPPNDKGECPH